MARVKNVLHPNKKCLAIISSDGSTFLFWSLPIKIGVDFFCSSWVNCDGVGEERIRQSICHRHRAQLHCFICTWKHQMLPHHHIFFLLCVLTKFSHGHGFGDGLEFVLFFQQTAIQWGEFCVVNQHLVFTIDLHCFLLTQTSCANWWVTKHHRGDSCAIILAGLGEH